MPANPTPQTSSGTETITVGPGSGPGAGVGAWMQQAKATARASDDRVEDRLAETQGDAKPKGIDQETEQKTGQQKGADHSADAAGWPFETPGVSTVSADRSPGPGQYAASANTEPLVGAGIGAGVAQNPVAQNPTDAGATPGIQALPEYTPVQLVDHLQQVDWSDQAAVNDATAFALKTHLAYPTANVGQIWETMAQGEHAGTDAPAFLRSATNGNTSPVAIGDLIDRMANYDWQALGAGSESGSPDGNQGGQSLPQDHAGRAIVADLSKIALKHPEVSAGLWANYAPEHLQGDQAPAMFRPRAKPEPHVDDAKHRQGNQADLQQGQQSGQQSGQQQAQQGQPQSYGPGRSDVIGLGQATKAVAALVSSLAITTTSAAVGQFRKRRAKDAQINADTQMDTLQTKVKQLLQAPAVAQPLSVLNDPSRSRRDQKAAREELARVFRNPDRQNSLMTIQNQANATTVAVTGAVTAMKKNGNREIAEQYGRGAMETLKSMSRAVDHIPSEGKVQKASKQLDDAAGRLSDMLSKVFARLGSRQGSSPAPA